MSETKPIPTIKDYYKKQPCNNCPYRVDAPLRLWSIEEFRDLLASDKNVMSPVYGCHKKDGHVCVGWLIDQDKRYLPNIMLRISLSRHGVTREYMDALSSPCELYETIEEMSEANYPELLSE